MIDWLPYLSVHSPLSSQLLNLPLFYYFIIFKFCLVTKLNSTKRNFSLINSYIFFFTFSVLPGILTDIQEVFDYKCKNVCMHEWIRHFLPSVLSLKYPSWDFFFYSVVCKVFQNVLFTKASRIDEILSHITPDNCFHNQFRQHWINSHPLTPTLPIASLLWC